MKRNIILSSLLLFAAAVQAQIAPREDDLDKIALADQQHYASRFAPTPQLAYINDCDVTYHRCEWFCDPAVRAISGKITTYFKPLIANFDSIHFNLTDTLTVDSIKYHNALRTFLHINGMIRISFPSVIPINMLDSIVVFYHGVPPVSAGFVQTIHASVPSIWTFSEAYAASNWWPCKDGLSDKVDSIDILVTCPSAYKVGSNGVLVSVTTVGPNKIFYWKHRYPIATYLICFAVSNYSIFNEVVPFASTNTTVVNYVYPEDSASINPQSQDVIPVMQLYDTLFGVYPFVNEKYGMLECGLGGGMEHQTMTFLGLGAFQHEILAHELGHHWFGDKITCASWEDIWLNEGFATYLSALTYEHMFNGQFWMVFKTMRINAICQQPGGSVWCNDTTNESRIFDSRLTYAKGAMILNQLRWVIGDSAFFAAINNYLSDPSFAYKFAHTSDLKAHFEASSGQNLTWYFNDWFTGEGFPTYTIPWSQVGNTVNFTVNQTQSHASVPFFELPIPIEFKNATNDTIIRFNHTFSGQNFSVNLPFTVDSVKFDPEYWIISSKVLNTSVKENSFAQQINVFPNPAHDKVQITFSEPFAMMEIKLQDVTGRIIQITNIKNQNNTSLDLSDLAKGIYFLNFNSEGKMANKKIVIE